MRPLYIILGAASLAGLAFCLGATPEATHAETVPVDEVARWTGPLYDTVRKCGVAIAALTLSVLAHTRIRRLEGKQRVTKTRNAAIRARNNNHPTTNE